MSELDAFQKDARPILEKKVEHLKKTLLNIIAVGDSSGSTAHRLVVMRDIADKGLEALSDISL